MMTVHWAYNLNVFETNFDLIITKLNFIFENFTIFQPNWLEKWLAMCFQCLFWIQILKNDVQKSEILPDPISSWAGDH